MWSRRIGFLHGIVGDRHNQQPDSASSSARYSVSGRPLRSIRGAPANLIDQPWDQRRSSCRQAWAALRQAARHRRYYSPPDAILDQAGLDIGSWWRPFSYSLAPANYPWMRTAQAAERFWVAAQHRLPQRCQAPDRRRPSRSAIVATRSRTARRTAQALGVALPHAGPVLSAWRGRALIASSPLGRSLFARSLAKRRRDPQHDASWDRN